MFRKILSTLLVVLFMLIAGCNREVVNLREMSPDEQFDYAKRIYDRGDYYKAKMQFTVVALNNAGSKIVPGRKCSPRDDCESRNHRCEMLRPSS